MRANAMPNSKWGYLIAVLIFALISLTILLSTSSNEVPSSGFTTSSLSILNCGDPLSTTPRGTSLLGASKEEYFGRSTSISSDGATLVVGSPLLDNASLNDIGKFQVLKWDGSVWNVTSTILGTEANERLGYAVAVSGDGKRVAVSAPGKDSFEGEVTVYKLDNNGTPIQVGSTLTGNGAGNEFGHSISLSYMGERIAIGSRRNDEGGSDFGAVKVYEFNTQWNLFGLPVLGKVANEESGWSVDISGNGNRIIVGARKNSTNGSDAGAARMYEYACSEWNQMGEEINGSAGSLFGQSVSMSFTGDVVAISEHYYDHFTGQVTVYNWQNGIWSMKGLPLSMGVDTSEFGASISLSDDGERIAVGERIVETLIGVNAGRTNIFDWCSNVWQHVSTIDAESHGVYSGASVSLSGNGKYVAIGEPRHIWSGNLRHQGRVRVIDLHQ